MDRSKALRQLRETPWTAPDASEKYTIGYFEPADAAGIARLVELESEFAQNDYALIQVFVDLGQAHCGAVVDELRRQGYSLGGFLPTGFGDDGLLMQKHLVSPDFEGIKLYSDRARALLEIVRRDWQRAHG